MLIKNIAISPNINQINCLKTKKVELAPCIMHFGAPAEKIDKNPIIMYNPIDNHFATKIGHTLYDITGKIDSKEFEPWDEFAQEDYLLTQRIIKDCILKI